MNIRTTIALATFAVACIASTFAPGTAVAGAAPASPARPTQFSFGATNPSTFSFGATNPSTFDGTSNTVAF
ncbi:MAG TPA: hypothetical protein VES40_16935 [Ilumatobacteraceae bacterium]|nr:hypothetical protein [Ilumatobacteraceae bacterium]